MKISDSSNLHLHPYFGVAVLLALAGCGGGGGGTPPAGTPVTPENPPATQTQQLEPIIWTHFYPSMNMLSSPGAAPAVTAPAVLPVRQSRADYTLGKRDDYFMQGGAFEQDNNVRIDASFNAAQPRGPVIYNFGLSEGPEYVAQAIGIRPSRQKSHCRKHTPCNTTAACSCTASVA